MTQPGHGQLDSEQSGAPPVGPDFLPADQQIPSIPDAPLGDQTFAAVEAVPTDQNPVDAPPPSPVPSSIISNYGQEPPKDLSEYPPPTTGYGGAPQYPALGYGQSLPPGYGMPLPNGMHPGFGAPVPYGMPQGYGQPNQVYTAQHPRAQTVFTLSVIGAVANGIVVLALFGEHMSLFFLGLLAGITSFFAWRYGSKAKNEIKMGAPFVYAGRLKTGHTLGLLFSIIAIFLWAFIALAVLSVFALGV